jgi:hypothetical protein
MALDRILPPLCHGLAKEGGWCGPTAEPQRATLACTAGVAVLNLVPVTTE